MPPQHSQDYRRSQAGRAILMAVAAAALLAAVAALYVIALKGA